MENQLFLSLCVWAFLAILTFQDCQGNPGLHDNRRSQNRSSNNQEEGIPLVYATVDINNDSKTADVHILKTKRHQSSQKQPLFNETVRKFGGTRRRRSALDEKCFCTENSTILGIINNTVAKNSGKNNVKFTNKTTICTKMFSDLITELENLKREFPNIENKLEQARKKNAELEEKLKQKPKPEEDKPLSDQPSDDDSKPNHFELHDKNDSICEDFLDDTLNKFKNFLPSFENSWKFFKQLLGSYACQQCQELNKPIKGKNDNRSEAVRKEKRGSKTIETTSSNTTDETGTLKLIHVSNNTSKNAPHMDSFGEEQKNQDKLQLKSLIESIDASSNGSIPKTQKSKEEQRKK